jgi:hypothetical protein
MRRLALVLLLAPSVALAKPKTISLDAGNGTLALTFDPAKISEADLRAAAAFAPESNPDGVLTQSLETCYDPAGKDTVPCGAAKRAADSPAFLRDGDLTIAKNRAIVTTAATRKVPKELEPAKEFLRRHLAFWAGMEEHKLAYYKTWKSADLGGAIEGVDGTAACAKVVAKIDAAPTHAAKQQLVWYDWGNCINDQGAKAIGEYPAAPWKAFLKAKGIKAKFTLPEGD